MLGPGSSKARNHLSPIGGKEGILGQNCSAHDSITTPSLPPSFHLPPASKKIKQQNYKCLLLPSQVYGVFYVGLSFDTKRNISKELSFCTFEQFSAENSLTWLGSFSFSGNSVDMFRFSIESYKKLAPLTFLQWAMKSERLTTKTLRYNTSFPLFRPECIR